jgi:hypothetical protein
VSLKSGKKKNHFSIAVMVLECRECIYNSKRSRVEMT